jgi:3-methyladenine DNA glycosylase AlkD
VTRAKEIIDILRKQENPANKAGMARYGIKTDKAFGVPIPFLRNLGRTYKGEHELAIELWETGYHEARILAGIIDKAKEVNEKQLEAWVKDFDSWDVCDQCCSNLFVHTPFAYYKAIGWSGREEEFIKRAGFVMMACIAVKLKKMKDEPFMPFLELIEKNAADERNMVKKAVNWALRQIGKRNLELNEKALKVIERLLKSKDKTTLWIAKDAYRELTSDAVQKRIKNSPQTTDDKI